MLLVKKLLHILFSFKKSLNNPFMDIQSKKRSGERFWVPQRDALGTLTDAPRGHLRGTILLSRVGYHCLKIP
jgi:hypothetical protein